MAVSCWYDYTCPYSYRAFVWLRGRDDVEWRTFSLREANSPPALDSLSSVSVHALALAHAVRQADFAAYHAAVFEALHVDRRRLTHDDLRAIARDAGADPDLASVAAVAEEHARGADLGVFGTPTLTYEGGEAVFLKLSTVPEPDGGRLFDALRLVAVCHPELVEIKRPSR